MTRRDRDDSLAGSARLWQPLAEAPHTTSLSKQCSVEWVGT